MDIDTLAFGGAGIGRYTWQDRPITVFVMDTVPGDIVEASLTKIKPNFWEADLVRVVQPSAERIVPRCKHFDICGGCTWQFLSYEKQLEYKESQVRESLEHIGKFVNPPVEKIVGCNDPWNYRNKMEMSFARDPSGEKTRMGFHLRGRRYEVFDLEECFLESPFFEKFVNAFRIFVKGKGWQSFHEPSNTGFLRSLFVREGKNTGELMINLVTLGESFPQKHQDAFRDFVSAGFPEVTSVYHTEMVQKRGSRTALHEHFLHGKPALSETLVLHDGTKLSFDIAPQAFFQPNTLQAQTLYSKVLEYAELTHDDIVFDLFCGTGTIGLFAAKKAKHVVGIEVNTDAVESANQNAKMNHVSNIEFYCGNVSGILNSVRMAPTCVIVDPPRCGLGEKTVNQIVAMHPKKIISVSCNPSTFARDAAMLCGLGYSLRRVAPVDMFPQTYHIETVAEFVL